MSGSNSKLARALSRVLPKGRLSRGLAVLAGGTAIGQGIAVLSQPVLSRLFTPDDFGTLAAYAYLLNILCVLPALTYERAIPMPVDDDDAAGVFWLSMVVTALTSALMVVVVALFGPGICDLLQAPQLLPYIWMLPLGFSAIGLYQNLYSWAIRRKSYKTIAKTKASQSVSMAVLQVGLGYLKVAPFGLLLGHFAGQTMGITSFVREIWAADKSILMRCSRTKIKEMARRFKGYPQFQAIGNLLNSVGLNLPGILLAALYGPATAGSFYFVQKLFGLPMQLVSSSASDVFFGEAATYATTDPKRMDQLFNRLTKKLFMLAIGPTIAIALLSGLLFPLVFGGKWQDAGYFAQIQALSFLLTFLFGFTIRFIMVERPDMTFTWSVIRIILVAGAVYGAFALNFSPLWAIGAVSLASVLSFIIKYAMWKMAIRRLIGRVALQG